MDHECVDACALDVRRARRMTRRFDACLFHDAQAHELYPALVRAVARTACPRARAVLCELQQLCACLVRAGDVWRTGRAPGQ